MPRDRKEVRQRLQEAVLALSRECGYDQTTTAEIAAKAGVTERTFFRHFPDKREVLLVVFRTAFGIGDPGGNVRPSAGMFKARRR